MDDLIRRADAIKAVSEPFDRRYWQYTTKSIRDTVKILKDIPAVEPKKGEWIRHKGGLSDHYECTACGKDIIFNQGKWDFCPNCGADMRGEK